MTDGYSSQSAETFTAPEESWNEYLAPNVVAYDADGGGQAEAVAVDTDSDARLDTVLLDTDGDAVADTVLLDTDGDAVADTVWVAEAAEAETAPGAADAVADSALVDTNADGTPDTPLWVAEAVAEDGDGAGGDLGPTDSGLPDVTQDDVQQAVQDFETAAAFDAGMNATYEALDVQYGGSLY